MHKHINRLKFISVLLTVAIEGGTSAVASDQNMIGSARSTAIHDCNIEANKFSPITQLSNQFACMATHQQRFG
jgi:hypothetical protein